MPFAKANDISSYYEMHGETGSPLIMIAGLGATIMTWTPELIATLSAAHRVIIFDNRGAGQTDAPAGPYTIAQFAADTAGLLDALEITRAHVLGVSMGGMIAQRVAVRYPERVLSLVLGCTAPGFDSAVRADQQTLARFMQPPTGDQAQDERNGWLNLYPAGFIAGHADMLERRLARQLAYPLTPAATRRLQYAAAGTHDVSEAQLAAIRCPVLIQAGREDILIPPENARILARLIPNARLIEYPDAGHNYWVQAPQAAEDVAAFLSLVDGAVSDAASESTAAGGHPVFPGCGPGRKP